LLYPKYMTHHQIKTLTFTSVLFVLVSSCTAPLGTPIASITKTSQPPIPELTHSAIPPENTRVPAPTNIKPLPTPDYEGYWPTNGWRTSTPENQGMDSEILVDMLEKVNEQDYKTDSLTIIRNGYIVTDAIFYPFTKDTKHIIHSCTKSIVSTLVGIAIDKGYIDTVDQPVLSFFPEKIPANSDAAKQEITLEHLLMMGSGLDCRDSYLYNWSGLNEMRAADDWVQHMLDLPMAAEPGTHFEYCNGGSYLLAAILQQTTGVSALAFAEKHLLESLGITDLSWQVSPQGINIGWGDMYLKPHDMAKLGYLYLNNGYWEGKQIIPQSWVQASTSPQIKAGTLSDKYGYQWWVDSAGYYMALGYAGQFIFVVPEKNLVVVFTSDGDFPVPEILLNNYILPAVKTEEPLPPNPDSNDRLKQIIHDSANPPDPSLETR
jgi:CubicO group peptidase (beta-lactamase class C family)